MTAVPETSAPLTGVVREIVGGMVSGGGPPPMKMSWLGAKPGSTVTPGMYAGEVVAMGWVVVPTASEVVATEAAEPADMPVPDASKDRVTSRVSGPKYPVAGS